MRQNIQGPPDDGRADRRARGRQHQRLEGEPGQALGGLLELLLARLPQRARPAPTGPTRSKCSVKRKGLRVRTRKGYSRSRSRPGRPKRSSRASPIRAADNPLNASLTVGEPKPYDQENYLCPSGSRCRSASSGSFPSGDRYEGQFFVYFVVLDASGKQSDLQVQRQEVKIPAEDFTEAQRKDFYYDATLIVVPGGQKLVDRRARRGLQPDVLRPEERLRLGAPEGGKAEPGKPRLRYGGSVRLARG